MEEERDNREKQGIEFFRSSPMLPFVIAGIVLAFTGCSSEKVGSILECKIVEGGLLDSKANVPIKDFIKTWDNIDVIQVEISPKTTPKEAMGIIAIGVLSSWKGKSCPKLKLVMVDTEQAIQFRLASSSDLTYAQYPDDERMLPNEKLSIARLSEGGDIQVTSSLEGRASATGPLTVIVEMPGEISFGKMKDAIEFLQCRHYDRFAFKFLQTPTSIDE